MYYSNGFPNSYEELKTFYPIFYLDVFEMDALLRVHGKLIDDVTTAIDAAIHNNFITDADEATIERLERFLSVGTSRTKSLEERRRIVLSLFSGFGKISASKIKEIVVALTNSESEVDFKVIDEYGNSAITITIRLASESTIGFLDVYKVLSRKIPAHLSTRFHLTSQSDTGAFVGAFVSSYLETAIGV